MKLSIDAVHQNLNQVRSMSLVTEPNNLGEFIEIQVAELRDGSLNVVIAGQPGLNNTTDSRGNFTMRVWPTVKR